MMRPCHSFLRRECVLAISSKQHMVIWGLSLHLGSSESRKTLEKKLSFKLI